MIRSLTLLVLLMTTLAVDLLAVETGELPWGKIARYAVRSTYIFVGELTSKRGKAIRITNYSSVDKSKSWDTIIASGTFKVGEVLRGSPGEGEIRLYWYELSKGRTSSPTPDPGTLSPGDRGVWFVHEDYFIGPYVAYRAPPNQLDFVRVVLSEMETLGLVKTKKQASEDEGKWREFDTKMWKRLYPEDETPNWPSVPGSEDSSKVK